MEELLDLEKLKSLTPEQQDQVIMGVKQHAAITNAQNLITVICLEKYSESQNFSIAFKEAFQCFCHLVVKRHDYWTSFSLYVCTQDLKSSVIFHYKYPVVLEALNVINPKEASNL